MSSLQAAPPDSPSSPRGGVSAPPAEAWSLAASHPDGFMALWALRDPLGALLDFRWLHVNPAAEALLGLRLAQVLGQSLLQVLPDLRLQGLHARFAQAVETGAPCEEEVRLTLGRRERWFRFVILPRGEGVSVWFSDISRRKREEREMGFLSQASHLLTASLDIEASLHALARRCVPELGDGCILQVLDGRGQPLLLETVATEPLQEALLVELLRRQEDGVSGLMRRLMPRDTPQLFDALPPALLGPGASPPPPERARSLVAVPLRARGRALGALLLLSSVPRLQGPEELRFAEELADRVALSVDNALLFREARRAVAQRDEFFTLAAHELRTPTTALKLNVQSMLRAERRGETGPLSPALQTRLRNIDRTAGRLNALVGELLDVTRIHAGRLRLEREEVDLGCLVRDVADRFRQNAPPTAGALLVEAPEPVVGRWDRTRLEQVVTHLLSNAIKYGAGRPVHLRVEASAGGPARLVVRDEGIGIPPENLPRLFGRFERAVSERHYGGLGLGLYITRQIVEALGGGVSVRSAPGAGATFTVELPRGTGD